MVVSALGMAVFWIATIYYSLTQGHPKVVGAGSSGDGGWLLIESQTNINWLYLTLLVSIILSGVAGILCLIWPARKPPRLNE